MPDDCGRTTLGEALMAIEGGAFEVIPPTPDDPSYTLVITGTHGWIEVSIWDEWPAGRLSGVLVASGADRPARWRITGRIER